MDEPELDRARHEADLGMGRAARHADRVYDGWTDDAYDFLVRYAEQHSLFISEDVSNASKDVVSFEQPPTDRAWGSVYRRALKDGIIMKAGAGVSKRRHATICPRWRSLVWHEGAP
jgi:hypothetical protein